MVISGLAYGSDTRVRRRSEGTFGDLSYPPQSESLCRSRTRAHAYSYFSSRCKKREGPATLYIYTKKKKDTPLLLR
jgi:hypothetical protein